MKYKIVLIGSTGGGVLSKIGRHSFVKDTVYEVVSDRDCGFLNVAKSFSIPAAKLAADDGLRFSDLLYERYSLLHNFIFLSFYTKLLGGEFLRHSKGFLFNCHPSLLPSFKGMHGFEDTIKSSCLFMGCSLHQIDEGVDTGECVIQAAIPLNRRIPFVENRHKVFLMQYYSTLQFIKWVYEDRLLLKHNNSPVVVDPCFEPSSFSPNLDANFFDFIGEENQLVFSCK